MLKIKGQASYPINALLGIVTKEPKPFYNRSKYIFVTSQINNNCLGYKAILTLEKSKNFLLPITMKLATVDMKLLHEGDIVLLNSEGISVYWEELSHDNAFMLTESCNCKCIMCPQPYKKHDPELVSLAEELLDLLKGRHVPDICITGGEPTILKKTFLNILNRCVQEHPEARVNILTNGKIFANKEFTKQTASISSNKVTFCISLHSDIDTIHNSIVGSSKSHAATEQGIYNLAQFSMHIEIRHVITKKNYMRLDNLAEYLYNYFPFCIHYAFMGMELCGYAAVNEEEIYISPHLYQEKLKQSVIAMHRRGLPISIYNIPLCLCYSDIHPFVRKSISSWKNKYLPQCSGCAEQTRCAGFFSTSTFLPETFIKPITKEDSCVK